MKFTREPIRYGKHCLILCTIAKFYCFQQNLHTSKNFAQVNKPIITSHVSILFASFSSCGNKPCFISGESMECLCLQALPIWHAAIATGLDDGNQVTRTVHVKNKNPDNMHACSSPLPFGLICNKCLSLFGLVAMH